MDSQSQFISRYANKKERIVMNNTLISIEEGISVLERGKQNINDLIERVKGSSNRQELIDIYKQIKLAKEYAKLNDIAHAMRIDFLTLEINCIINLYRIDYNYFTGNLKKVAIWYSKLPEERLNELIKESRCSIRTANGLYNDIVGTQERKDFYTNKGKSLITDRKHDYYNNNEYDRYDDKYSFEIDEEIFYNELYAMINSCIEEGEPFTIRTLRDKIISKIHIFRDERMNTRSYIKLQNEQFLSEAIDEVCRHAVRMTKHIMIGEDIKAPRFITCRVDDEDIDGKGWIRIPFEYGTLCDLKQMLDLRKEQLRQDCRAYMSLRNLYKLLKNCSVKIKSETLQDIVDYINEQNA